MKSRTIKRSPYRKLSNGLTRKKIRKAIEEIDYCTGVSESNVGHCCKEHDELYDAKDVTRAQADKAFLKCMKKAGWGFRAYVRYFGVRILGWTRW